MRLPIWTYLTFWSTTIFKFLEPMSLRTKLVSIYCKWSHLSLQQVSGPAAWSKPYFESESIGKGPVQLPFPVWPIRSSYKQRFNTVYHKTTSLVQDDYHYNAWSAVAISGFNLQCQGSKLQHNERVFTCSALRDKLSVRRPPWIMKSFLFIDAQLQLWM